jgi:hypothetical protein
VTIHIGHKINLLITNAGQSTYHFPTFPNQPFSNYVCSKQLTHLLLFSQTADHSLWIKYNWVLGNLSFVAIWKTKFCYLEVFPFSAVFHWCPRKGCSAVTIHLWILEYSTELTVCRPICSLSTVSPTCEVLGCCSCKVGKRNYCIRDGESEYLGHFFMKLPVSSGMTWTSLHISTTIWWSTALHTWIMA